MEKDVSQTGQVGSSSGLFQSSSTSLPPLLDYNYGSQYFSMHEADLMMMASSSHQKELLMDLLNHQVLVDHHSEALFQLKAKLKEAQDLEKENYNLNIINANLINCLAVHQKAASDQAALFGYSTMSMDPKMNLNEALTGSVVMSLASEVQKGLNLDNVASEREIPSPTLTRDMTDSSQLEGSGEGLEDRVSLPKSISVRSRAYSKKIHHPGRSKGGRGDKHKVFVQGEEKEENSVELDVFKQGMSKTELCNKWQETGSCLYEEKCQFSHGIEELRPVIRHPRYKTDVCRMVLNGDPCNYGHRCHFRHSLSEQEELMRSNNLRTLKPLNQ